MNSNNYHFEVVKTINGQKNGGEYARPARFDKLNSNDLQVKSVRIYSRLSLKPMVIEHRGNPISCRAREMFVESNLILQWVPGSGKVVRGGTKMSPCRESDTRTSFKTIEV